MALESRHAERADQGGAEPVHAELRRRAALEGQSLQEYLLDRLIEVVQYPPLDEVLDRAGGRSGGRPLVRACGRWYSRGPHVEVIVVDASVVAPALADDGDDGDRARAQLRGERLLAPELLDLEVVSALRRAAEPAISTVVGRGSPSMTSWHSTSVASGIARWSSESGSFVRT